MPVAQRSRDVWIGNRVESEFHEVGARDGVPAAAELRGRGGGHGGAECRACRHGVYSQKKSLFNRGLKRLSSNLVVAIRPERVPLQM
jgi:hypothetical protein